MVVVKGKTEEMGLNMGEICNRLESVETNVETMKGYLYELQEMIVERDEGDKGITLVEQDLSPLYSPLVRGESTYPLARTEEAVGQSERAVGRRQGKEYQGETIKILLTVG